MRYKIPAYIYAIIAVIFAFCTYTFIYSSLSDGEVDPNFKAPNPNNDVRFVVPQSDGSVVIAGQFTSIGGTGRNYIARLTSTGLVDPYFNPNPNNVLTSLKIQPDGKILLGGFFTSIGGQSISYLARLTSTGLVDPTFNANVSATVRGIVLQPDNHIIIGGDFAQVGGVTRARLARLTDTGALDTTFTPIVDDQVLSVGLQPDGNVLFGGRFSSAGGVGKRRLARVSSTGLIDILFTGNTFNSAVETIAVQSDGKALVGGSFTVVNGITRRGFARLTTTGYVDTNFDPGARNVAYSIVIDGHDNIIVGGSFTGYGSAFASGLIRLTSTGQYDPTFPVVLGGGDRTVFSIGFDATNASLVIGGNFTTVNGTGRVNVARIGVTPSMVCGDSIVQQGEACDDGNTNNNDGCNSVCGLETPQCTVTSTVSSGFVSFPIGFTGTIINTGAIFSFFSTPYGGFGGSVSNVYGPITVTQTGTQTATYTVRNVYSGSVTNTCSVVFTGFMAGITIGGCGDGAIQGGEQCDDWNINNNDGCSSSCQLEMPSCTAVVAPTATTEGSSVIGVITGNNGAIITSLFFDTAGGSLSFSPNSNWYGSTQVVGSGTYYVSGTAANPLSGSLKALCYASGTAYANVCGNGFRQGSEQCDDNNTANGDGCSSTCTLETPSCTIAVNPNSGYAPLLINIYTTGSSFGVFSNLNLGNGISYAGNRTGALQTGYTYSAGSYIVTGILYNQYSGSITNMCSTAFSLTASVCGDNIIQTNAGEQCDGGNAISGDGCSNTCQLETPTCSLTATPDSGFVPLSTIIDGIATGGEFTEIMWDNTTTGSDNAWSNTLTTGRSYTIEGNYTVTGTAINPYSGSLSATCSVNISATVGGGGPVRVIPTDSCPNGDYSPTPYDNQCGTRPSSGGGSMPTTTGATVVSGATTTGNSTTSTGITFTGTDTPSIPDITPLDPDFPLVPLLPSDIEAPATPMGDLYTWARINSVTTLTYELARPEDTVLRYELAKMLVNFAENVMHSLIPHNPLCAIGQYGDYETFDAEMHEMVTKVCDLGLMGRSIRNEKILDRFRPFDTLSVEELNIVIERYLGRPVNVQNNTRIDVWEFLKTVENELVSQ